MIWTPPQRVVLAVAVMLIAAGAGVRLLCNPTYIPNPQPPDGARAAELQDRIDPNTADWPAWASLPGIGEKRAKQIVAWRDEFVASHPGTMPFRQPQDLLRIKGIGVATMEELTPYLAFPAATTQP